MKDLRQFYKTKTFWGALGFGVLIVVESLGFPIPMEAYGLVTVYTGYSIADRFRNK